jgi:hypothetical protein
MLFALLMLDTTAPFGAVAVGRVHTCRLQNIWKKKTFLGKIFLHNLDEFNQF